MRNVLAISSLCVGAVIILAGFTPALALNPQTTQTALVPIVVAQYFGSGPVSSRTMVTPADADKIQALASELSLALDRRDMRAAADCVNALKDLGIAFGPAFLPLMKSQDTLSRLPALLGHQASTGPDENLSNSACILKAIGEGMMIGPIAENFIKQVAEILHNASGVLEALVLLLVFLPLIVLFILFNALIPFRILMPHGTLVLANGTISTRGAEGYKKVDVGANHAQVNVTTFTGITLNIIPINNRTGFCFILGFAGKTEGFIED